MLKSYHGVMMSEVVIFSPLSRVSEREYIFNIVFEVYLGIKYTVNYEERESILIVFSGSEIKVSDDFFSMDPKKWLAKESLPRLPFQSLNLSKLDFSVKNMNEELPVFFGGSDIVVRDNYYNCEVDIFGSIFFIISRYEEYLPTLRDEHDRFQLSQSVLYENDLYLRPLVNEYLELLWGMMISAEPNLKRLDRSFEVTLSHDVDRAFEYYFLSIVRVLRMSAAEIIRRKSIVGLFRLWGGWLSSKISFTRWDIANKYQYLMSQSEKRGIKSKFNFIINSDGFFDRPYSVSNRHLKKIIGQIITRGHEIGFHGGYNTYLCPKKASSDLGELKMLLKSSGFVQMKWQGRQHYLQCRLPETIETWSSAGLAYDSTLGYAENIGFRCGTCYPFPLYNIKSGKVSTVVEYPLMVMDSALFAMEGIYNLESESVQKVKQIKNYCRFYQGSFVFLWHNSNLDTRPKRNLYEYVLDL